MAWGPTRELGSSGRPWRGLWDTFATTLAPTIRTARQLTRKPLLVGETGAPYVAGRGLDTEHVRGGQEYARRDRPGSGSTTVTGLVTTGSKMTLRPSRFSAARRGTTGSNLALGPARSAGRRHRHPGDSAIKRW
jgi:hypothetical protein